MGGGGGGLLPHPPALPDQHQSIIPLENDYSISGKSEFLQLSVQKREQSVFQPIGMK